MKTHRNTLERRHRAHIVIILAFALHSFECIDTGARYEKKRNFKYCAMSMYEYDFMWFIPAALI